MEFALQFQCALMVFLSTSKLKCQCPTDGFAAHACRWKDFSALLLMVLFARSLYLIHLVEAIGTSCFNHYYLYTIKCAGLK